MGAHNPEPLLPAAEISAAFEGSATAAPRLKALARRLQRVLQARSACSGATAGPTAPATRMTIAQTSIPPWTPPIARPGGMQAWLLRGYRILIVEDEYFLADDLAQRFEGTGAVVLGPVGTVQDSIQHIVRGGAISVALLDIRLGRELVFPVADALAERLVPFVFCSAYDEPILPARFQGIRRVSKIVGMDEIVRATIAERALAEAQTFLALDDTDQTDCLALLPPLRLMARLLTGDQANADELVAVALGRAIQSPNSLARHASPFRWLACLLEQAWIETLRRRPH